MVRNLLASGHRVRAWDMSSDALNEIRKAGAQTATGATDAFRGEAVISMLPDDDTMRTTFLDAAVLRGGAPIHVNMATASACTDELAAAHAANGVVYVSAPVFGRDGGRAQSEHPGGRRPPGDRAVQPLFDAMGRKPGGLGPSCATRMSPRSPAT